MRRITLAAIALTAAALPAAADCTEEVKNAYAAMAKKPFVKMETNMITGEGIVKMTLEFQTPDRMRQVVSPVVNPKPLESIVIGEKAWTQDEKGWFELPHQAAEQFGDFRDNSMGFKDDKVKFECLGTETMEGKQVRAYKLLDPTVNVKGKELPKDPSTNEAVRVYYIDAEGGLPVRAIFAHKDRLNQPIQKEVYSFPDKITIEPPANVQPPPTLVNEPKDMTKPAEKK